MRKIVALLALCAIASSARADEGMWTYNGFPKAQVEKKYGAKIDDAWLDHARLSSARLAQGCSASFVSPSGLVLTNHHCVETCLQQLSSADKDYIAQGFQAKTAAEELKCPVLEVNQLVEITDVTARMKKATAGLEGVKFNDAQKAETSPHRGGVPDQPGAPLQRGDALPRRPLRPVPLPALPGRAHGLRARVRHRLLRRRPRQLHVPALRPRPVVRPRLRRRQAAPDPELPGLERRRPQGGRPGLRLRPPGRDRPAADHRRARVPARRRPARDPQPRTPSCAARSPSSRSAGPSRSGSRTASSSASRTRSRPCKGEREALVDREFFAQKVAAEEAFRKKLAADKKNGPAALQAFVAIQQAEDLQRNVRNDVNYVAGSAGLMTDYFRFARTLVRGGDERPQEERGAARGVPGGAASRPSPSRSSARPPSTTSSRSSSSPGRSPSCARSWAPTTPSPRRCSATSRPPRWPSVS